MPPFLAFSPEAVSVLFPDVIPAGLALPKYSHVYIKLIVDSMAERHRLVARLTWFTFRHHDRTESSLDRSGFVFLRNELEK